MNNASREPKRHRPLFLGPKSLTPPKSARQMINFPLLRRSIDYFLPGQRYRTHTENSIFPKVKVHVFLPSCCLFYFFFLHTKRKTCPQKSFLAPGVWNFSQRKMINGPILGLEIWDEMCLQWFFLLSLTHHFPWHQRRRRMAKYGLNQKSFFIRS